MRRLIIMAMSILLEIIETQIGITTFIYIYIYIL